VRTLASQPREQLGQSHVDRVSRPGAATRAPLELVRGLGSGGWFGYHEFSTEACYFIEAPPRVTAFRGQEDPCP
jgi:hypothetical protein